MVVKRKPKPLLIIITLFFILVLIGLIGLGCWSYLLAPVDKKSDASIIVVIPEGSGVKSIAKILKDKNLIKNDLAFVVYTKINNTNSLKASTYELKKSMNLEEIVDILQKGNSYNPDEIKITFKEGEKITDYSLEIANNTVHTPEEVIDVMTDKEYISTLISKYWFLTDEILNPNIYYPLEGYLFPNTYHFENNEVAIQVIIDKMLQESEKQLEKYKEVMISDPHHYITMASMLELEGTNTENRKMIAGVFNNRLAKKMNLGSDVTTYYALQHPMTSDLTKAQFATDNPYNTRSEKMAGKMPIGPICNPSISSIEASVKPTESDYLYFVADKHGQIFYTKTYSDHIAKVNQIKEKGDWIW